MITPGYIKKFLNYPHKASAFRYFLSDPSLAYCLSPGLIDFYFRFTIQRIFHQDIASRFRPSQRLIEDLTIKKYIDAEKINALIYLIVRELRPKIVVETGVARGASSAFILAAMEDNKFGKLYSIELPASIGYIKTKHGGNSKKFFILADNQIHNEYLVGELIPEYLKERWTLIIGDARNELPLLLESVGSIDLFFHDSLHTYDQMYFEYENSWPYINKSGLLLSHDILWNSAFLNFSRKVKRNKIIYFSLGLIKK